MGDLPHRVGGGVDLLAQLAEGPARRRTGGPLDIGELELEEPEAKPSRTQVQLGAFGIKELFLVY